MEKLNVNNTDHSANTYANGENKTFNSVNGGN
jgi:hypothetical protein